MRLRWIALTLALAASRVAADSSETRAAADQARVQKAGVKTDGEGLLAFFKSRTVRSDPKVVQALVNQLSARQYAVRQKASAGLVALGARAVPQLREALEHPELEVRRRAEDCLRQIQIDGQPELIEAAARMLALRKPPGAAEALLDFLPSLSDHSSLRELHEVLSRLVVRDGKPEEAAVKAMGDEEPMRRAAAASSLSRAGARDVLPKIKGLLADKHPSVRLHAAVALAARGEREAVPVLIELFGKLPRNDVWEAEDLLYRLAMDKAPAVALGDGPAGSKAFVEAWQGWWKDHGDKLDLPTLLKDVRRDWTLLVLLDEGEVLELDAKDKERFRISKVAFPLDAQTLPGDRVLLAEHGAGRVVERLRDGTVLWEKRAAEPIVAQRLPNGRTFIAARNSVMEVDREGKIVFSWSPEAAGEQVMRARKLDDGTFAVILHNSQKYVRIDADGRQIDSFGFNVNVHTFGGRLDVQPDGGVLIPQMYMNKVVEYDGKGKPVREIQISQPIVASRLPNGNTLVTSYNENRAVELDSAGKEVWEYKAKTRVSRAYRR